MKSSGINDNQYNISEPFDTFDSFDGGNRDRLEEYLLICQELFIEMERSGNWPWSPSSSKSKNLVEFGDKNNDV